MEILSAAQALACIADGHDTEAVGVLAGRPALAIRAERSPALDRLAGMVAQLPCVVVACGDPSDGPVQWADVAVTPTAGAGAPWVSVAGPFDEALMGLQAAIDASPEASVTLVQVLRLGDHLAGRDALVVESLAYGVLQTGAVHQAWLGSRRTRSHHPGVEPPVLVDRGPERLTITLNRPAVRNAFDAASRDALVAALDVAAGDPTTGRVELRGAGPDFCAGGDLGEFGSTPSALTGHLVRSTRSAAVALSAVADRVTAHVHGACVGAGIELPAFCGRVEAHPSARFHLPEVAFGLIPGAGGTASLPPRIGRQRTAWMGLTGAAIDVPTALAWGLIDAVGGA